MSSMISFQRAGLLAGLIGVLTLAPPGGARAAGDTQYVPTRAFLDAVAASLVKAHPTWKVTISPKGQFEVIYFDGQRASVGIDPRWKLTDDAAGQNMAVQRLMRLIIHVEACELFKPEDLVPQVRTDVPGAEVTDDTPLFRPFLGRMAVTVVAQRDGVGCAMDVAKLKAVTGLQPDGVWALTMSNMRRKSAAASVSPDGRGNWDVRIDDGLGVSLLLDDSFWARPEFAGPGDLVALAVPDGIYVTRVTNDVAVGLMRTRILPDVTRDYPGPWNVILVRRNGQWEMLAS